MKINNITEKFNNVTKEKYGDIIKNLEVYDNLIVAFHDDGFKSLYDTRTNKLHRKYNGKRISDIFTTRQSTFVKLDGNDYYSLLSFDRDEIRNYDIQFTGVGDGKRFYLTDGTIYDIWFDHRVNASSDDRMCMSSIPVLKKSQKYENEEDMSINGVRDFLTMHHKDVSCVEDIKYVINIDYEVIYCIKTYDNKRLKIACIDLNDEDNWGTKDVSFETLGIVNANCDIYKIDLVYPWRDILIFKHEESLQIFDGLVMTKEFVGVNAILADLILPVLKYVKEL